MGDVSAVAGEKPWMNSAIAIFGMTKVARDEPLSFDGRWTSSRLAEENAQAQGFNYTIQENFIVSV